MPEEEGANKVDTEKNSNGVEKCAYTAACRCMEEERLCKDVVCSVCAEVSGTRSIGVCRSMLGRIQMYRLV